MSPQFETVLFDFDYTLCDPSDGVATCVNFALRRLGVPAASREAIHAAIGTSLRDTFRHLAGDDRAAEYDEFLRLFVARADDVMVAQTNLLDGVQPLLTELKERNVALGIVSMKYRDHITPVLARENLLDHFQAIVGGDDVSRPKPDPEGVRLALETMGASASTSVYVGDNLVDAETAQQAGIAFVAVRSGGTSQAAFERHGPYPLLPDVSALPTLLDRRE